MPHLCGFDIKILNYNDILNKHFQSAFECYIIKKKLYNYHSFYMGI